MATTVDEGPGYGSDHGPADWRWTLFFCLAAAGLLGGALGGSLFELTEYGQYTYLALGPIVGGALGAVCGGLAGGLLVCLPPRWAFARGAAPAAAAAAVLVLELGTVDAFTSEGAVEQFFSGGPGPAMLIVPALAAAGVAHAVARGCRRFGEAASNAS
ncbi:hypothetical protein [Streptomyces sp. SPB162]|uniref:hypothetical protein n=1 Tax=Streptomyces sp. SPB162 TaxID=2940560 RepID=UPI0024060458|nr:hypothetical protein [Streptomyces sp. SPB162]MDF9815763.1 putative membrane protein [Streptomyces sp. SPB162]